MMRTIINHRLMPVNDRLMVTGHMARENQPMVVKPSTFSDRFNLLRGGMAYEPLSQALERKTGHKISAQALFKYAHGHAKPSPKTLDALARFFGVRAAWLLLGEEPQSATESLEDVLHLLPSESGQQVMDFIKYKFERADGLIAAEKMADYFAMIDRIKSDMEDKLVNDGKKPPSDKK